MIIEAVRTDDSRFVDLPDWPYQTRYVENLSGCEGLRMHYIDEGPKGCERDAGTAPREMSTE